MSRLGKDCELKKVTRVVCKDVCKPKNKGKRKPCTVVKKKLRRRTIKIICKAPKAPVVNLTTPPVNVTAPDVHVTTPPPVVNVETAAPIINVETPKPDVHVKVEAPKAEVKVKVEYPDEEDHYNELRDLLREYMESEIELFTSSGAGSGGEPPNRIGMLERIGQSTLQLRPTTGNTMNHIAIFSLYHIIGFRPYLPVEAP